MRIQVNPGGVPATEHITLVTLSERNVQELYDSLPYLTPGRTFTLRKGATDGKLLLVQVERDDEHYGPDGRAA